MLDIKDAVMALAFEPRGSRFAMIHAENPSSTKVNVSFYDMMKQGDPISVKGKKGATLKKLPEKHPELHKVTMLEGRQCTGIFWSPAGSNIILASLGDTASGTLEFYNVDEKTIVMKEHYRANQVAWDPSGRTVATIVSQPLEGGHFKFAMDNGYILWSFQGKQMYQQSFEAFYQFVWRPRETLLSKKEVEEVQKNLKKYEKQFDKADKERERALYLEETKGKRMERSKYREVLARNKAFRQRRRAEYVALLDGYDSEDDSNFEIREVQVETVLKTTEELVM
jgi:translation initiation factor 3 subunit B